MQQQQQETQLGAAEMQPVKNYFVDSIWCTYMVSVVAANIAELATYPLDLTKTRLQIQGEAMTKAAAAAATSLTPTSNASAAKLQYRGMMCTAIGIVREEGAVMLWRGYTTALYRHLIYSGGRIVVYDFLRKKLSANNTQVIPIYHLALCGVTAGGLAQWLASPADLVKVHVQMEGRRQLMGLAPRVTGAADALRKIVRKGGVRGLWKGSVPNVHRAALVNLGDLTTYDTVKRCIMVRTGLPDCPAVHVMASICAGFMAAGLGTPADVVKTRVMNQPTDASGCGLLYRGSIDCLRQTVEKEGFMALYKGFLPVWIRMAPWALTFWMSFEQIRKLIGASEF